MFRTAILGFICILTISCSEKQKEADRLAADLKAMQVKGDSASDSSAAAADTSVSGAVSARDSLSAVVDSMVRQSLAETPQTTENESPVSLDGAEDERQAMPADSHTPAVETTMVAEPIMPPRPVEDGFVVQIASTINPEEAKEIVARFAGYGYPAYPQSAQVDGIVWYRVRVGPYPTSREADSVLTELHQEYQVAGWIAKHR